MLNYDYLLYHKEDDEYYPFCWDLIQKTNLIFTDLTLGIRVLNCSFEKLPLYTRMKDSPSKMNASAAALLK